MSSGESIGSHDIEGALNKCSAALSEIISLEALLNASAPLSNLQTIPRISWARILVLKDYKSPSRRERCYFRQEVFGSRLAFLISGPAHESEAHVKQTEDFSQGKIKDQVASVISNIVVETLRISAEMLEKNFVYLRRG
jgi:hypothetical protein